MAVNWQTGEPPCGQELLIEYCFHDKGQTWRAIIESTKVLRREVNVLRWSTLDDDRAAMAMGALEKLVREQGAAVGFSVDFAGNEWTIYDENGNDLVEAPTIIEAVEKLTEAGNGLQGD